MTLIPEAASAGLTGWAADASDVPGRRTASTGGGKSPGAGSQKCESAVSEVMRSAQSLNHRDWLPGGVTRQLQASSPDRGFAELLPVGRECPELSRSEQCHLRNRSEADAFYSAAKPAAAAPRVLLHVVRRPRCRIRRLIREASHAHVEFTACARLQKHSEHGAVYLHCDALVADRCELRDRR